MSCTCTHVCTHTDREKKILYIYLIKLCQYAMHSHKIKNILNFNPVAKRFSRLQIYGSLVLMSVSISHVPIPSGCHYS